MRQLRQFLNLCSLICCWLLRLLFLVLFALPLLINPSNVFAQTATSGVVTASPGATSTPRELVATTIRLDFRQSEQFFTLNTGNYVPGVGFQLDSGSLILHGNGNEYALVNRVVFGYQSSVACTADYFISYLTDVSFSGSLNLGVASDGTAIADTSPGLTPLEVLDDIALDISCPAGDFTLTWIDLYVFTGVSAPDYDVVDGCPVLTDAEIDLLDPIYRSQCSRCFTTPTPVRDSVLVFPTALTSQPTVDLTSPGSFQIPVIISGTPQTPTPFGTAAPASTLAPGTPTATPPPTATPIFGVITFDFTGSQARGWNTLVAWGGGLINNPITSLGWQSDYNAGSNEREYFQLDYSGAAITGVTALAVTFTSTFDHYDVEFYDTDGANVGTLYASRGGTPTGSIQTEIFTSLPGGTITLDGWAFNGFSNQYVTNPPGSWYIHKIEVQTSNVVTATPTYTPSATITGAPWVQFATATPSGCELAVFRDDSPVVEFPDHLEVWDYQCYTIIPEIVFSGGESPSGIDGVELCVTWVIFPVISFLGFGLSIDWLLVGVLAFLIRILLSF